MFIFISWKIISTNKIMEIIFNMILKNFFIYSKNSMKIENLRDKEKCLNCLKTIIKLEYMFIQSCLKNLIWIHQQSDYNFHKMQKNYYLDDQSKYFSLDFFLQLKDIMEYEQQFPDKTSKETFYQFLVLEIEHSKIQL